MGPQARTWTGEVPIAEDMRPETSALKKRIARTVVVATAVASLVITPATAADQPPLAQGGGNKPLATAAPIDPSALTKAWLTARAAINRVERAKEDVAAAQARVSTAESQAGTAQLAAATLAAASGQFTTLGAAPTLPVGMGDPVALYAALTTGGTVIDAMQAQAQLGYAVQAMTFGAASPAAEASLTGATELATTAVAEVNDAMLDLTVAQMQEPEAEKAREKALTAWTKARSNMGLPPLNIDRFGCPTNDEARASYLLEGSDEIGAATLCRRAVADAPNEVAATAIAWTFMHLGAPYACGGVGRDGPWRFDCSSFLAHAYESAGVPMSVDGWPHTTYTMMSGSTLGRGFRYQRVSSGSLQPGDLVFYDTPGPNQHVAMYIGGNWMVHTNNCGGTARVVKLWSLNGGPNGSFLGVRRVS